MTAPESQEGSVECRGKVIFVKSGATIVLFLSFIHPFIPPLLFLLSCILTPYLSHPSPCSNSSPQLFSDCQARHCKDTGDHLDLVH